MSARPKATETLFWEHLDTRPKYPEPSAERVKLAAQSIPRVLEDVPPNGDGQMKLVASELVQRLQNLGHTLHAAQWAIHQAIEAKRLIFQPTKIDYHFRKVQHEGEPIERRQIEFTDFRVVTTQAWWEWVGKLTPATSASDDERRQKIRDLFKDMKKRFSIMDPGRDRRDKADAKKNGHGFDDLGFYRTADGWVAYEKVSVKNVWYELKPSDVTKLESFFSANMLKK